MNKTIKVKKQLAQAVITFCESKENEKAAKRESDSAKAIIAGTFAQDTLAMERGDVIQLDAGKHRVNIERVDKTRVDLDALRMAHPALVEQFTKPVTEYHFKGNII